MKTAKDIILKALSYDGLGESAKGNIIFNTDYYGGKVNRHIPWCCTFIWDIFRMEGASKLFFNGKKTAYVPAVETYAKRMKKTVKKDEGELGDIALFDFSGSGASQHIGFIVSRKADGSYVTIEGNTSPGMGGSQSDGMCVAVKVRTQNQIRCIYRPKYPKAADGEIEYKKKKSYHLLSARSLRTKPSLEAAKLGTLGAGRKITCLQVKKIGKNTWIRTEKGWIAAYYNGHTYVG